MTIKTRIHVSRAAPQQVAPAVPFYYRTFLAARERGQEDAARGREEEQGEGGEGGCCQRVDEVTVLVD